MRINAIGARVSQAQYGTGTITKANEYHTTIDFDLHGPRTFVTSLAALSPSDTLAAPKPAKTRRKRVVSAVPA